jgi:hypothetical protein
MLFLLIPKDQSLLPLESLFKLTKCSLHMITETGMIKTNTYQLCCGQAFSPDSRIM